MNGRVYDPTLGRFLSADPYVQAPYFSQSYNRYTYTFNNPLIFNDPSGYLADENVNETSKEVEERKEKERGCGWEGGGQLCWWVRYSA